MILEWQVEEIKIPYAQYAINENQLINAIPLHPKYVSEIEVEGFECVHWGTLSDLNFIMESQMRNSLALDNWDFEKYPNPEILIMTKQDYKPSIQKALERL